MSIDNLVRAVVSRHKFGCPMMSFILVFLATMKGAEHHFVTNFESWGIITFRVRKVRLGDFGEHEIIASVRDIR